MAQHRPSGSETSPSYAPRSSRFGSEPPSVEDDVNVWRYAIVSCMSETTMLSVTKWYYIVVCSVLFCGQVDENMKTAQKRDAVLNEKFYFRKDLTTCEWVMNSLKWFSAVLLVLSLYHSIQFCVVLIALMSHVKLSHVESLICSILTKSATQANTFVLRVVITSLVLSLKSCFELLYGIAGVVAVWLLMWLMCRQVARNGGNMLCQLSSSVPIQLYWWRVCIVHCTGDHLWQGEYWFHLLTCIICGKVSLLISPVYLYHLWQGECIDFNCLPLSVGWLEKSYFLSTVITTL